MLFEANTWEVYPLGFRLVFVLFKDGGGFRVKKAVCLRVGIGFHFTKRTADG